MRSRNARARAVRGRGREGRSRRRGVRDRRRAGLRPRGRSRVRRGRRCRALRGLVRLIGGGTGLGLTPRRRLRRAGIRLLQVELRLILGPLVLGRGHVENEPGREGEQDGSDESAGSPEEDAEIRSPVVLGLLPPRERLRGEEEALLRHLHVRLRVRGLEVPGRGGFLRPDRMCRKACISFPHIPSRERSSRDRKRDLPNSSTGAGAF